MINNKIKNLLPGDKINFVSTDDSITINGIDAYTKAETATEIGKLVNGAPAVLDTLKEIADFIGDSTTISGNLINLISNKSNSSDTFLKSVINTNDISLTLSPNKRILGTSTANQFKFQILDNAGGSFTDAWIDVLAMDFNTTTKKCKISVKDSLFIDSNDIVTLLNNKLSITDKKLTETAVNFSSVSYHPDGVTPNGAYNSIHTGTDLLSIKVDSTTASAAFFGISAGSQKGNVLFYKSIEVMGVLKLGSIANVAIELANKVSLSNTIEKTILNNDIYLTISNNKRIIATTTGNQYKFQIKDDNGSTFTDAWIDVCIMDFNATTKKAKLTVKDSLFVDTLDIITTLNNKVNNTDLSAYAKFTTTAIQTFLGEIKAPIITLGTTNLLNTAASWTSGASSATHTINVGPNWLSVNTPNRVAFEVLGPVNGAMTEGETQFFYNVTVPSLTVQTGGINSSGNIDISRSAQNGGEVASSISNTGQNGYSSLFLNTKNQSLTSANETGQLFVGSQSLNMITRTAHPIHIRTFADDTTMTVPHSISILSNSTRDVIINTPLIVNNNVTISGFLAAKPYISLKVTTSGGTPSTGITVYPAPTTIGTPGTATFVNIGYQTNVTLARGTPNATNWFLYTFSWTTPHPLGLNYSVGCTFQSGSTSTASPNAFFTANATATSITVWIRSVDNIVRDGNFYVYSIP